MTFHTTVTLSVLGLCLLNTVGLADRKREREIPKPPELGAPSSEPMPALGSLSGAGTAVGGVTPKRVVQVIRQSSAGVEPSFRSAANFPAIAKLSRSVVLVVTPEKLGSGTVIAKDGTILTNWHTLQSLPTVGVIFKPKQGGRAPLESDAVQATVLHADPVADLALIKIANVPADVQPISIAASPRACPAPESRSSDIRSAKYGLTRRAQLNSSAPITLGKGMTASSTAPM